MAEKHISATGKSKMNKFQTFIIGSSCAFLIVSAIYLAFFSGPKTVEIDESHFRCTAAEAHGIVAKCTQYTYLAGAR
jgi:hypothetical protein